MFLFYIAPKLLKATHGENFSGRNKNAPTGTTRIFIQHIPNVVNMVNLLLDIRYARAFPVIHRRELLVASYILLMMNRGINI